MVEGSADPRRDGEVRVWRRASEGIKKENGVDPLLMKGWEGKKKDGKGEGRKPNQAFFLGKVNKQNTETGPIGSKNRHCCPFVPALSRPRWRSWATGRGLKAGTVSAVDRMFGPSRLFFGHRRGQPGKRKLRASVLRATRDGTRMRRMASPDDLHCRGRVGYGGLRGGDRVCRFQMKPGKSMEKTCGFAAQENVPAF
ncbi:hypothetical protein VTI74DRAFT_4901 [Chaetomium olivicolor]